MSRGDRARERSRRASAARAAANRKAPRRTPEERLQRAMDRAADAIRHELARLAAKDGAGRDLRGLAALVSRLPEPKLRALMEHARLEASQGRGGMAAAVLAAVRSGKAGLRVIPEEEDALPMPPEEDRPPVGLDPPPPET